MTDAVDGLHEAGRPDPAAVNTPAEFVAALRRLQRGSGLSYREVEKRASHTGNPLPRSTLTAALTRSTLPREHIVVALVQACEGDEEQVQRWVAARRRIASSPGPDPAPADAGAPAVPAGATPPLVRRLAVSRRTTGVIVLVLAVTALAVIVGRFLVAPAVTDPDAAAPGQPGPVAPAQGTPLARDQPCPDGWLCLYEHPHFNRDQAGRMLKFQDDYWQPLQEWDFDNHASSARNLLGRDACLSADWPVGASRLRVATGADPSTLSDWDDQASGIKLGPC